MRALHQFVPSLRAGDAVGAHTLRARDILRQMGFESEIFAESAQPAVASEVVPVDQYLGRVQGRRRSDNGVLYQMATGSRIGDFFQGLPERKAVDYHNFTPARFFLGWDDREALRTDVGRSQMERLAPVVEMGLADSAFNESELLEAGYSRTRVAPILLDLTGFDVEMDTRARQRLERRGRRGADLLFVGRFAPNKAQHHLVTAFAAYRRLYDSGARLHLVGGGAVPRYFRALRELVARLDLDDAVDMSLGVSHGTLAAYYDTADVFVCLSEHEGFCIPLLEAMHHELPVLAFAATAVPATMGDAGLLLHEKRPTVVAAAIDRLVRDEDLRSRLVGAGRRRLADFSLERSTTAFEAAVSEFVEGRS